MKKQSRLVSCLVLASGLSILAFPALAERGDCGMEGLSMDTSPQHQKKLHDALNLTPQQEGAWQKYTQSLRQQPAGHSGKRAEWSTLSAPERAEQALESSKHNQEYLSQLVTGMKTFYGTLNPDQQKTFDRFHGGQQSDQR